MLYNEDNEGDNFIIAEDNGRILAWAQATGGYIYFIESDSKGAGTAIVNWLKTKTDYLQAIYCSNGSASYWEHQGFTKIEGGRGWPDYEWNEDE